MSLAQRNKYVIPKALRGYYHFGSLIVVVGTVSFSILMWFVTFMQDHTQIECGAVALIFLVLAFISGRNYFVNVALMNMKYDDCENQLVNTIKQQKILVDTCSDLYFSKITVAFYMGKSSIDESFLICANRPFPPAFLNLSGGLKDIKSIISAGAVVLPMDFCDDIGVLKQLFSNKSIPSLPRIGYIPKAEDSKTGE